MSEGAHHDGFLSLRAASRRLGCSRALLRGAIARGELAAFRPGARTILVNWPDVVAYLQKYRVQPTASAEQLAQDLLEREGDSSDQSVNGS